MDNAVCIRWKRFDMYEEIVHTHLGMVDGRYCKKNHVQLREYKKNLEYRLNHRLSKFDRSVFLILKSISYFFGLFFYLETIGVR